MKTITADSLPFAPRWLGQLMYPGGVPVRPENVSFEGKSIQQLVFDRADGKEWSAEHTEFLKQYIIYYAHAPMYELMNPYPEFIYELRESLSLDMTVDELVDKCLEYGLDPL